MVTSPRTDSFDYRTELLSPPPPGEVVPEVEGIPSWRINMDNVQLPEKRVETHRFGLTHVFRTSKFFFSPYKCNYIFIYFFFLKKKKNQMSLCLSLLVRLERQRQIAEYYNRQEKLLESFNEVDSFSELGILPDALTKVGFYLLFIRYKIINR